MYDTKIQKCHYRSSIHVRNVLLGATRVSVRIVLSLTSKRSHKHTSKCNHALSEADAHQTRDGQDTQLLQNYALLQASASTTHAASPTVGTHREHRQRSTSLSFLVQQSVLVLEFIPYLRQSLQLKQGCWRGSGLMLGPI
jgi:hypothetical protein